ncbi:tetratricopeptide repeat protein [bacterium]|nr:tetratricopeptide repeat protein [bacterium]
MKCPKCKAPVNPEENVCQKCGTKYVVRKKPVDPKASEQGHGVSGTPSKPPLTSRQAPKTQVQMPKVSSSAESQGRQPSTSEKAAPNNRKESAMTEELTPEQRQASSRNAPKTQVAMHKLSSADAKPGPSLSQEPGLSIEDIKPGTIFAQRYKIVSEIGRGGMGAIFRAEDLKLKETVALKLLLPGLQTNQQVIQRFIQEIKLSLKITHENVIRIYDIGEVGRINFISMEFIEGIDLKKLIRTQGKLPLDYGIEIVRQMCEGLSAAHKKGITHRDVKPQNILINLDNNIKIVDFGIAKVETSDGMTREGVVIGTPEYMSPEQALAKKIDYRTDIYSVGVIMYEIFTGELPFQADTPLGIALKHVNDRPGKLRDKDADIPRFLEDIVLKAMEKDPAKRFQSMEEMIAELDRFKAGNYQEPVGKSQPGGPASGPDLDGMSVDDLFQRGMDLFNQRKYREALQCFELVLKKDPVHPKAYDYLEISGSQIAKEASIQRLLREGEQAFQRNDFQTAHALFIEADELVPNNPEIQIALRKVKASLGAVPSPMQPQAAAMPSEPIVSGGEVGSDFQKGMAYYQQKKYDEAIEYFSAILTRDPNHTQSYEYLEMAKAAKSAQEEIEHHFLTAQRLVEEGDNAAAINELQITLDYNPDHEGARQLLERLETMTPAPPGHEAEGELELEQDQVPVEPMEQAPSEKVPDRDPDYIALLDYAKIQARDNHFQEAISTLKKAMEQFPDYPETEQYIEKLEQTFSRQELKDLLDTGKAAFQQQKFRQALRSFTQLVEKDPTNADARHWLEKTRKELLEERKKLEDTRSIKATSRDKAVGTEPGKPLPEAKPSVMVQYAPYIGIASIIVLGIFFLVGYFVIYPSMQQRKIQDLKTSAKRHYVQEQYGEAASQFQELYNIEPDLSTLEYLGKSYYLGAAYLKAQEIFQRLLKEQPDNTDYLHYLGLIFEKKDEYTKSIEQYQRIIELEPQNAEAYKLIGTVYFNQKIYDRTISFLTICLELKPQQADVQKMIADAQLALEQIAEAELSYKNAIQIDPRYMDAYLALVGIYKAHNRIEEAITLLNGILVWNTTTTKVYCLLGEIYDNQSKASNAQNAQDLKRQAQENFEKCLSLDPQNRDVVISLARIHISNGNLEKGASLYQSYLIRQPRDGDIHFELGTIYHRLKQYKFAYDHYSQARDISPNDPRIWANLGTLYYDMDNPKESRRAFQRSLELDPNQPRVEKFLEKVKRQMKL